MELAVTAPALVPNHIVKNIHDSTYSECVELLKFINSSPLGRKAINKLSYKLSGSKRKMLGRILNATFITPFDKLNASLEWAVNGLADILPG